MMPAVPMAQKRNRLRFFAKRPLAAMSSGTASSASASPQRPVRRMALACRRSFSAVAWSRMFG